MMKHNRNSVPDSLQQLLDRIAPKTADRKHEIVDLLHDEQPSKSQQIQSTYTHCIWWEGCYYCRDKDQQWQRVQCFM